MRPCLRNPHLVEVLAGKTWEAMLKHRVYSCPDTASHDFVLGATCLLLKNNQLGRRVLLNVEAVETHNPTAPDFLSAAAATFRARLSNYKDTVQNISSILGDQCDYRFYFLSGEPWPDRMQQLTDSVHETEWAAILSICAETEKFFEWPQVGSLLWPGCVRTLEDGQHEYPEELKARLNLLGLSPDTRTNGPAIISYLATGGKRPTCGGEGWHIHHIYDGTNGVPHAVRDPNLFTHSAGLVAAHPTAHHLAHQSELLKWLLRREAFLRFGYDPMNDFVSA